MFRPHRIHLSLSFVIFSWILFLHPMKAHPKSFVAEATTVISNVKDSGEDTNKAIVGFYQDFNRYASKMVALEERIEDWKKKGYLCDSYEKCPEKYDAINEQFNVYMKGLEQTFLKHKDAIQDSLCRFHTVIYKGIDSLRDLKSDDLANIKLKWKRLKEKKALLDKRREEVLTKCPKDNRSRECRRLIRSLIRDQRRFNEKLKRLAFERKIAGLRNQINERLDQVMKDYSHLQETGFLSLAKLADLFSQYEYYDSSSGLGYLVSTLEQLKDLGKVINDMNKVSSGLEMRLTDMAQNLKARSNHLEFSGLPMETISRTDELETLTKERKKTNVLMWQMKSETE